jgi:hypothetical protein
METTVIFTMRNYIKNNIELHLNATLRNGLFQKNTRCSNSNEKIYINTLYKREKIVWAHKKKESVKHFETLNTDQISRYHASFDYKTLSNTRKIVLFINYTLFFFLLFPFNVI